MVLEGGKDTCTTIRNLLCNSFATSSVVKTDFESNAIIKKEQSKFITNYCESECLLLECSPPESRYLTRGGEAKIYLDTDNRHVIKLNSGIYYATWLEFFNSMLLHNLIFTNTPYELIGFLQGEDDLYAVVKQIFVTASDQAELNDIKKFLEFHEFENTRRNDYVNKKMGLILEDMHDENVIVNSDTLFFIDSVFYTVAPE